MSIFEEASSSGITNETEKRETALNPRMQHKLDGYPIRLRSPFHCSRAKNTSFKTTFSPVGTPIWLVTFVGSRPSAVFCLPVVPAARPGG
jgi:hypothetical protein